MGYFPGKQTAKPSRSSPSKTGGGSSSGGGGSSSTPYNTSPALRPDLRAEREAANISRGVTSTDRAISQSSKLTTSKYIASSLVTGSMDVRSTLLVSPNKSTTQKVVESFKAPKEQFRIGGGASVITSRKSFVESLTERQKRHKFFSTSTGEVHAYNPEGAKPKSKRGGILGYLSNVAPVTQYYSEKASRKANVSQEKYSQKASRARAQGKYGSAFAYTGAAFGIAAASYPLDLAYAVSHPVKTAKGIGYTVAHPMEAGASLGGALVTKPEIVGGKVAGAVGYSYGASKLIGATARYSRSKEPASIKSFSSEKTYVQSKPSAYSSSTIKSNVRYGSKSQVDIGSISYNVKSKGRSQSIFGESGGYALGKTQHTVVQAGKKPKTFYGGSKYEARFEGGKDYFVSGRDSITGVKIGKNTYVEQRYTYTTGSKVGSRELGLSISTKTKSGIKTVTPTAKETWQYKDLSKSIMTGKAGKQAKSLSIYPESAKEYIAKYRPDTAGIYSTTKTKGIEITREAYFPKAPYVRTKTKWVAEWKGKSYQQNIPKNSYVLSTPKILTSKKASLSLSKSDLIYKPITLPKPKSTFKAGSSFSEGVLLDQARSAARLAYIYRPVPSIFGAGVFVGGTVFGTSYTPDYTVKYYNPPKIYSPIKSSPIIKPVSKTTPSYFSTPVSSTYSPPITIPKSGSIPETIFPHTPSYPGAPLIPPVVPPVFPLLFSLPNLEFLREKKRKNVLKGQKKKYTPSISAISYKIFGKQPKRVTGFGLRPITQKRMRFI